jgi:hypothetical protein
MKAFSELRRNKCQFREKNNSLLSKDENKNIFFG